MSNMHNAWKGWKFNATWKWKYGSSFSFNVKSSRRANKLFENNSRHNVWELFTKLNLALMPPPLRFFQNARKRPLAAPPFLANLIMRMLWKFQTHVTQGRVTRSHQVNSLHKKFECSSKLQRLNHCLETFSLYTSQRVHKMYISEFYIGDQYYDLSIISQWVKTEKHLLRVKLTP